MLFLAEDLITRELNLLVRRDLIDILFLQMLLVKRGVKCKMEMVVGIRKISLSSKWRRVALESPSSPVYYWQFTLPLG